jgi:hypothetical protein
VGKRSLHLTCLLRLFDCSCQSVPYIILPYVLEEISLKVSDKPVRFEAMYIYIYIYIFLLISLCDPRALLVSYTATLYIFYGRSLNLIQKCFIGELKTLKPSALLNYV